MTGEWVELLQYRTPPDPDYPSTPTVLKVWRDNLGGVVLSVDVGDGTTYAALPLPAAVVADLGAVLLTEAQR